ncbi:MAG: type II secretion system F family protein [Fervidicoccaceae archaeon]
MEKRFLERASMFSHRIIGKSPLAIDLIKRMSWLHRYLEIIEFRLPDEYYFSFILMTSVSVFITTLILSLLGYVLYFRVPAHLSIALSILLAFMLGTSAFGATTFFPVLMEREIRARMESGALFAIIALTASASSGLNLVESLAESEMLVTTKEIKASFRRIIRRLNEGLDLRDALIEESELVPSRTFSVLYEGLASISMSGVGLSDFLVGFLSDLLSTMEGKVRNVIDRLGILVETYIIIAIIFPFLLVIMLLMAGTSGNYIAGINQTLILFDFGLLPFIFIMLSIIADMILREVAID